MRIETIRSEGLAAQSYFVVSGDEAFVVDPRRDASIYTELAKSANATIRYIFETHRNEDYVIGSCELNHATGAEIFHGSGLPWKYGNTISEKQVFTLGDLKVTSLLTPGHTHESISYLITDSSLDDAPLMVFTGDIMMDYLI